MDPNFEILLYENLKLLTKANNGALAIDAFKVDGESERQLFVNYLLENDLAQQDEEDKLYFITDLGSEKFKELVKSRAIEYEQAKHDYNFGTLETGLSVLFSKKSRVFVFGAMIALILLIVAMIIAYSLGIN